MPGQRPALHFRVAAFALLASVLFVLALAANPGWHERAHEHGEDETHECVVDLFASGAVDGATPAPLILFIQAPVGISLPAVTVDVPSSFLAGSILEHAPPASA